MNDAISQLNQNQSEEYPGQMLDLPDLNVKDYFKEFIKHRSIEELISFDNKIFSELRNLDSEKHILVTQNYKKFVIATETINTIKGSLSDFEKDLNILQGKITSLVDNYSIINSSIDGKLKESEKIYKIKKDLKKLKTVNDLPNILENQLNEFLALDQIGKKDIKILEKALIYYERCKDFIRHHKDNSLVKDIFTKTENLIKKYQSIIHDELHIPEFCDSNLDYFECCLGLLVKIEEDNSYLKTNLIDRFKSLMNKKYDEIFSMNEGVSEISYLTFSKIYDNYEFAINENEFLFYEQQLEDMRLKEKEASIGAFDIQGISSSTSAENKSDNSSIQNNKINLLISQNSLTNNLNLNAMNSNSCLTGSNGNFDCKNLSSKFFKKGSFIWICKKINENIVGNYIISSFNLFKKLFINADLKPLENLYAYLIEVFFKKLTDLIEKNKDFQEIDPIFLKEGLSCFYYPFCEAMNKIETKSISAALLSQKILNNNERILNNYLKNFYLNYVLDIARLFGETIKNIFNNLNNNLKQNPINTSGVNNLENNNEINSNLSENSNNTNTPNVNNNDFNFLNANQNMNNLGNLLFYSFYASSTAKIFLNNEISFLNNKLQNLINEKIGIIKKLDIQDILSLSEEETNRIHFNNLISIYEIPFFVVKCFNIYRKESISFSMFYSSGNRSNLNREEKEEFELELNIVKKKAQEILDLGKYILNKNNDSNEKKIENKKDYETIFFFVFILFIKSFENPKALNDKFLKNFIEIKSSKQMRNELSVYLEKHINYSLFILLESLIQLYDNYIFKKLKNLFFDSDLQKYENAITFRLPLRDLLIELFHFKKKLLIILEEEAKIYNETKLSTLNEALLHKKQRKLTKFQKEMECLSIRRLEIFNLNMNEEIFPQTIMKIIVKIFLKNINEFVKLRKFNKQGFQQIQIDLNLVKTFFKENLIIDVDNILDGFFLEIMNNSSLNTKEAQIFDEQLLNEMIEEYKKEFKEISKAWDFFQQQ